MLGIPDYAMQLLVVLTTIGTVASMELLKRKHYYGWYVSIANQFCWLTINVEKSLWAFLLLNAYIVYTSGHAIILWKRHAERDRLLKVQLGELLARPAPLPREASGPSGCEVNEFTRRKLAEDGFYRKPLPPIVISNDELDRQEGKETP